MSKYEKLIVVGEKIEEDEWDQIEKEIDEIENVGMKVVKIINYKQGSTKYIASVKDGLKLAEVRPVLESIRWKLLSPYYSNGVIIGFKVARDREAKDVSAWGGV